jgi:hypothetical protein
MSERHCLKCRHCVIDSGSPGYSEYTPGSDPQQYCAKDHWSLSIGDYTREDMRKAFDQAKTCSDYSEESP